MREIVSVTRVILFFFLIYFNATKESFSQTSAVGTSAVYNPCGVPTELHVTNLGTNSGVLVWKVVNGSTGYVVRFRQAGSSSWRRQTSQNNTETITGLIPGTQYEAKVRSACGETEGLYCALYSFTTHTNNPCGVPDVYYFTSDSITSNTCIVGWKNIPGVTNYNVQYRIRYSNSAWLTGNASVNSLNLSGLSPVTQYEFCVQSVCGNSTGTYSLPGIFTTKTSNCGIPGNLSVTNITLTTADLNWAPLSCSVSYSVLYRLAGSSWNTVSATAPTYHLTNLAQGTGYEFMVHSVDASGTVSSQSSAFSFTTSSPTCGVVSNLSASSVTTNEATLSWTSLAEAISYNVNYRLAGASGWNTASTTANNILITGLSADNAYEFQVQCICSSSAGSFSQNESFITLPNTTNNIPVPDHVVICIMENKAYNQIFGSTLTPNINNFSNDTKSALMVESYGITHPSQPNYLHLFAGGNQGVTDNNLPAQHFNTQNLARELLNAGRTFVEYNEGLPSAGYDGISSGRYVRRHNPIANWMGTGSNQVSSLLNQPYTSFPADYTQLPTVSIVVPNLDNDMHDGTLATALTTGDNWFFSNMYPYIQWAKTHNSLFILTTDEDDGAHSNRILTVLSGEMIIQGSYSQPITHYNILRTIEEMYGLNFIGASASASAIQGCWTNGFKLAEEKAAVSAVIDECNGWKVYPNPSYGEIHAAFELSEALNVTIRIYNSTGSLLLEDKLGEMDKGKHVYDVPVHDKRYPAGLYFMDISYGTKKYIQRFLISQ